MLSFYVGIANVAKTVYKDLVQLKEAMSECYAQSLKTKQENGLLLVENVSLEQYEHILSHTQVLVCTIKSLYFEKFDLLILQCGISQVRGH